MTENALYVARPEWLFLDEATPALGEAPEARLYHLTRERLTDTTLFSVGHRTTLRRFHVRRLNAEPAGDGVASIVEVPFAIEVGSEYRSRLGDERAKKRG